MSDLGYLYVIEFSTGTVKVGMTANGRGRISTHRGEAKRYGVEIARSWLSEPHVGYAANEQGLILWARCQRMASTHSGNEYFTGLNFDAAVAHASELASVTLYGTGDWLTLEQVAKRTAFSVSMIVRLIKRGEFRAEVKGRHLMVRTRDLVAWMKAAPSAATERGLAARKSA